MTREFDRAREDALALPGYLFGLTMSTVGSSVTLTVNWGFATDSSYTKLIQLRTSLAKTTSSWVVGAGGGLDTGSIANNTWYHWYLIYNPSTDVGDVVFSATTTPANGPTTLPSGYTKWRRIGAAKTNGSAQWIKFVQDGDKFLWDVPVVDVNVVNPGTSAVARTLSVPLGLRLEALTSLAFIATTLADQPGSILLSDLSIADTAPVVTTSAISSLNYNGASAASNQGGNPVAIMTNTLAQIRSRMQLSASGTTLVISTLGWIDTRGQLA